MMTSEESIKASCLFSAKRVSLNGGDFIAQDKAEETTKKYIEEGKTKAYAMNEGFKAGMAYHLKTQLGVK